MKANALGLVLVLALLAVLAHPTPEVAAQVRPSVAPAPRMLERPQLAGLKEPSLEPGAKITAYELSWIEGGPDAATRRLTGALQVLLGEEEGRRKIEPAALAKALEGEEAGSWTPLAASPVLVRYQRELDEIRVIHEELDRVSHPSRDIGEERAREVAEKVLGRLGETGAIDARIYDAAALQVGYKMVGAGPVAEEVQPGRVVEYRFTFRPRLGGVEMANAGVRLGILASGELVSLRFGGVTPLGEWRDGRLVSTAAGAEREIRVGTDELMRRFHQGIPKGAEPQVAWSRVMYAMPEGATKAVVEPMLIVSYSLQTESDGQRVVSRRRMLGYSLTDPEAAPVDFDAPAAKHEGIEPTRKAGAATTN